jgi:competence protein ComEC
VIAQNRREILKFIISLPFIQFFVGCDNSNKSDISKNSLNWTSINVCTDTQQGDAHFISKNGKSFLIDTGHFSTSESNFIPFLKEQKITKIDAVILSHTHSDHYGGVESLFKNNISIDKLYMNIPTEEQMSREWWGGKYQDLVDIKNFAENNNTKVLPINQGNKFIFTDDSYMEVLYVYDGINTPVGTTDINDMSAIIMIYDGSNRFLLTGDLNKKLGTYLAENAIDIDADILKVPHHGTEGLAPNIFFDKVNPKDIIVTSPKSLWCSDRSERVRNLSKDRGYGTYVNGFHGHITVISYENNYKIVTQYDSVDICEG